MIIRMILIYISIIAIYSSCTVPHRNENKLDVASKPAATMIKIRGSFSYMLRIALPPDAKVEFTLRDISVMDIEAPLLAKQQYVLNGRQVPLHYEMEVEQEKIILEAKRYAVAARITSAGGQLLWVTDTNFTLPASREPIIEMGNLLVVQVK